MLEQLAAALDQRDYKTAAKIVKTILHHQPDNEQAQLYAARLETETDQPDRAMIIYQQLLRHSISSKVRAEAREGIERIQARKEEAQAEIIKQAHTAALERPEPGVLILEPMAVEQKQAAVPKLAQIMKLDLYSARLQLPSRGWRLYRSGKMGELQIYQNQLEQAGIPSFCATLADVKSVSVFRVNYMQFFDRQVKIFCTDDRSEKLSFRFDWSEITQVVKGLLPIFEEVMEIDAHNRTKRKSRVLDYVDMCDLHLASRRTIFRLCSQTYEFREHQQLAMANSEMLTGDLSEYFNRNFNSGILTGDLSGYLHHSGDHEMLQDDLKSGILTGDLSGTLKSGILNKSMIPFTSHNNWQSLIAHIQQLADRAGVKNEFTPFADTALAFPELLSHINSHIELLRRADSQWDQAFQLYSALSLCQYEQLHRFQSESESSPRSRTDAQDFIQPEIDSRDLPRSDTSNIEYN
jgi:hypothetical protein